MGAPLRTDLRKITGGSLIYSGYPEAKASFLGILACSLLSLFLPRNRIAKRVADIAPLVLSAVSFVYGVKRSAVAVWQSSYPFSHTYVGLIASVLSALIYRLGLSIWADCTGLCLGADRLECPQWVVSGHWLKARKQTFRTVVQQSQA
jgi:hypothetical protein